MKCPICSRGIEPRTVITCKACWPWIKPGDRVKLARLHRNKQDNSATMAKVIPLVRSARNLSVRGAPTPAGPKVIIAHEQSRATSIEMIARSGYARIDSG